MNSKKLEKLYKKAFLAYMVATDSELEEMSEIEWDEMPKGEEGDKLIDILIEQTENSGSNSIKVSDETRELAKLFLRLKHAEYKINQL